eukprot:gene1508-893_t
MSVAARQVDPPRAMPLSARERDQNKEAESLEVQAAQAERSGDDQECITLLESALRLRTQAATNLSDQHSRQPDNERLRERYRAAARALYDAAERLVVKCNTFGVQCFKNGDFETATKTLNFALQLTDMDSYPLNEVEELRRSLRGVSLNNLGCMERLRGHFKDALSYMQQSMEVTGVESAVAYMNISAILVQLRLSEDAMNMGQRAIELLQETHGQPGEDPSLLAVAHHNLAMALEPVDPDRCLQEYESAYRVARQALGAENPTTQAIERNWVRYQQRHRPHQVIQPAFQAARCKSVKPKSLSDALAPKHPPQPPSDDVSLLFPHPFTQSGTSSTTKEDRRNYTAPGAPLSVPAREPKIGPQQLRNAIPGATRSGGSPTTSSQPGKSKPRAGDTTSAVGGPGAAAGGAAASHRSGPGSTGAGANSRSGPGAAAAAGGAAAAVAADGPRSSGAKKDSSPSKQNRHTSGEVAAKASGGEERAGGRQVGGAGERQGEKHSTSPTNQRKSGSGARGEGEREKGGGEVGQRRSGKLSTSAADQQQQQQQQQRQQHRPSGVKGGEAAEAAGGKGGAKAAERHSRERESESGPAGAGKPGDGNRERHSSGGRGADGEDGDSPAAGGRSRAQQSADKSSKPAGGKGGNGKEARGSKQTGGADSGGDGPASASGKGGAKARKHRSGGGESGEGDGSPSSNALGRKDGGDRRGTTGIGGAASSNPENASGSKSGRHVGMGTAQEVTLFELAGGDLTQYMIDRLDMLIHDEEELERKYVKATIIQKNYRGHYARRLVAQERENRLRTESLRHIKRSIAARIIQLAVYRHLHIPSRLGERKGPLSNAKASYAAGSDDTWATKIQRIARGWLTRRAYRRLRRYQEDCRRAAHTLQRWVRRMLAQKKLIHLREEKFLRELSHQQREQAVYAATKIQSIWRGHLQKTRVEKELARRRLERVRKEREERYHAARCIQCAWRCCAARMEVHRRRTAKIARDELRKFYVQQRNATVKMQSFGRMLMERQQYLPELTNARLRAAKNVVGGTEEFRCATTIQTAWRGFVARRELLILKDRARRALRDQREHFLASMVQRVGRGYVVRRRVGMEIHRLDEEARRYQERLAELARKDEASRAMKELLQAAAGLIACLEEEEDDVRQEVELSELRWRRTYQRELTEAVAKQTEKESKPHPDAYVPATREDDDDDEEEEIPEELPSSPEENEGSSSSNSDDPSHPGGQGPRGANHKEDSNDDDDDDVEEDNIPDECDGGVLEEGEDYPGQFYQQRQLEIQQQKEEEEERTRTQAAAAAGGSKPPTGDSSAQYEEVVEEIECDEELDSGTSYEIVVEEIVEGDEEIPEEIMLDEANAAGVTATITLTEKITTTTTTTTTTTMKKKDPAPLVSGPKHPVTSKYLESALDIAPAPTFEVEQCPPPPKPLRQGPRPPKKVKPVQGDSAAAADAEAEAEAAAAGAAGAGIPDETQVAVVAPGGEDEEDEASFEVLMAKARQHRDEQIFEHYRGLKLKERLRDEMHAHRMQRIDAAESEEALRPLGFTHGFGATAKRWKHREDDVSLYDKLRRRSPSSRERAREDAALKITSLVRGFLARQYVRRIRLLQDEGPQRAPIDTTKLQRFGALYPKMKPPKREAVVVEAAPPAPAPLTAADAPILPYGEAAPPAPATTCSVAEAPPPSPPAPAPAVAKPTPGRIPSPPSTASTSSSVERRRPLTQEQLEQERAALARLQQVVREVAAQQPPSSSSSSSSTSPESKVHLEEMLRQEREAITRLQKLHAELTPLPSPSSQVSSRPPTRDEVERERELLLRLREIDEQLRTKHQTDSPAGSEPRPSTQDELHHERSMILRLKALDAQLAASDSPPASRSSQEEIAQERELLRRLQELNQQLGDGEPTPSPSTSASPLAAAEVPPAAQPTRDSSSPASASASASRPPTQEEIRREAEALRQLQSLDDAAAADVLHDLAAAEALRGSDNSSRLPPDSESAPLAVGVWGRQTTCSASDLPHLSCTMPRTGQTPDLDLAAFIITQFMRMVLAKKVVQRLWNVVQDYMDARVEDERAAGQDEEEDDEAEEAEGAEESPFAAGDPFAAPAAAEEEPTESDAEEQEVAPATRTPLDSEGAGCITPASSPIGGVQAYEAIQRDPGETEDRAARKITNFMRMVLAKKTVNRRWNVVQDDIDTRTTEEKAMTPPTEDNDDDDVGAAAANGEEEEEEAEEGQTPFASAPTHEGPFASALTHEGPFASAAATAFEKEEPKDGTEPPSESDAKVEEVRSSEEDEQQLLSESDSKCEEQEVAPATRTPLDSEGAGCITPASSPIGGVQAYEAIQRDPLETEDRAARKITNFMRGVAAKKKVQRCWNDVQDAIDARVQWEKDTMVEEEAPAAAAEESPFAAGDPFAAPAAAEEEPTESDAEEQEVAPATKTPLDSEGAGCITPASSPIGGVQAYEAIPRDPGETEDRAARKITNFMRMVLAKKKVQRAWDTVQDRIDQVIDEDKLTPDSQKYITAGIVEEKGPFASVESEAPAHEEDEVSASDARVEEVPEASAMSSAGPMDSEGAGCITPASSPIGGVQAYEAIQRDPAETEDRAARKITNFFRSIKGKRAVQRRWYDVQDAIDARVQWEKDTMVEEEAPAAAAEESPFAAGDPFAAPAAAEEEPTESDAEEQEVAPATKTPLDSEGAGCITPASSPIGGVQAYEAIPRDPGETEDRAARKITNFMRMVLAKKKVQRAWDTVQDRIDQVIDEDKLTPDSQKYITAGISEAPAHEEDEVSASDARVEEVPEASAMSSAGPMDSEGAGCITPASSPIGGVQAYEAIQRDPAETEDRAARKIAYFFRGLVAKRAVQRRWYDVQDYIQLRVQKDMMEDIEEEGDDEGPPILLEEDPFEAASSLILAENDFDVDAATIQRNTSGCSARGGGGGGGGEAAAAAAAAAGNEDDNRTNRCTSTPCTMPPSRGSTEEGPSHGRMANEAAKKISSFLRQVVARRRLADLRLANLKRLEANIRADNDGDEAEAVERIQGLYHVFAARRLLQALRNSRVLDASGGEAASPSDKSGMNFTTTTSHSDASTPPRPPGSSKGGAIPPPPPPHVGTASAREDLRSSSNSSCITSVIDPGRSTAPPEENEERGLSRGSDLELKSRRLG